MTGTVGNAVGEGVGAAVGPAVVGAVGENVGAAVSIGAKDWHLMYVGPLYPGEHMNGELDDSD